MTPPSTRAASRRLSGECRRLDGAGFAVTVDWGAVRSPGFRDLPARHDLVQPFASLRGHDNAGFPSSFGVVITVTSSDGRPPVTCNQTITGNDVLRRRSISRVGQPRSKAGINRWSASRRLWRTRAKTARFTYNWTATDGNDTPRRSGLSPTFNFVAASPASYSVSLTVTDADGNTANASLTDPLRRLVRVLAAASPPSSRTRPRSRSRSAMPRALRTPARSRRATRRTFRCPIGASNMPAEGNVDVFYNTQDGNAQGGGCPGGVAHADTDYTSTAGVLTFTYATGYARQIIPVNTSAMSSGGTFSMLATYFLDPSASTTNSAAAIMLSAVATIASQPVTGKLTIYKPGEGRMPSTRFHQARTRRSGV